MQNIWGGLLESLQYCEDSCDDDDNKELSKLKYKIRLIENSTSCEEIKWIVRGFTKENLDYLNSPLLDEIYDTINKFRPMLECCRKNKPKALEFYLTKEKFRKRNKGFLVASRKGYTEIIKILVKYGVNVRIKDDYALKNAVKNNYVEIAQILLKNGSYYAHAIYTAVKEGYMEIIEFLWKYSAQNLTKDEINCAFCNACCDEKKMYIVKFFVEKFKNTIDVFSGLINGAVHGCEEIVFFLLETYNILSLKNINSVEYGLYRFWTPMIAAISGKNERIINKFFELNADISSECLSHACASSNDLDLVMRFAVYFPVTEGCLRSACRNNNREILEFLMERYRGSYRELFIHESTWNANLERAKVFYEKYKNSEEYNDTSARTLNYCLRHNCTYTNLEMVEFILNCGADPNYPVTSIREILNHKKTVELLVKYGAKVKGKIPV